MKFSFSKLLLFILLTSASFSCQKSDNNFELSPEHTLVQQTKTSSNVEINSLTNEKTFELKVKPLSLKHIQDIAKKLQKKKKEKNSTNSRYDIIEETPFTDDVTEIETVLNPLVQNGKSIHSEILAQVQNTPEWELLTDEDKYSILNFTDIQYADLAFAYSLREDVQPIEVARLADVIHDCVGVALGIYGIKSVFTGIFTVEKGISLLRIMGRRYLSYIGIAWMIWDFTDCVAHFD